MQRLVQFYKKEGKPWISFYSYIISEQVWGIFHYFGKTIPEMDKDGMILDQTNHTPSRIEQNPYFLNFLIGRTTGIFLDL
jgi:hypothetical protein